MMVTTACPLAAHSTHSRMASLPLTSAATSSSPAFLPSCVHLSRLSSPLLATGLRVLCEDGLVGLGQVLDLTLLAVL
jgi:hypothetical protein